MTYKIHSRCDSTKVIFEGECLKYAYLEGADLRGAYLGGADLGGANLIGANLGGANLRHANLIGAYLGGAYLGGADLRDANLGGADLRDANLRDVNLRDVNLWDANLWGAKNIISLTTSIWAAYITTTHVKIGCKYHTHKEWKDFTKKEIKDMDVNAWKWWKAHRKAIFKLIKTIKKGVI